MRCVFSQSATNSNVGTLCAFTADDEVNIRRSLPDQWSRYTFVEFDGAQINVMVQVKAQGKQNTALKDP